MTINNISICKICNRSVKRMGSHVINSHNITPKEYYDEFLLKENEGICYCGKKN